MESSIVSVLNYGLKHLDILRLNSFTAHWVWIFRGGTGLKQVLLCGFIWFSIQVSWFGIDIRRPQSNSYVGHRFFNISVAGQHSRRRPKKRWIDTAEADARINVQSEAKWKRLIRKADPGICQDKSYTKKKSRKPKW